MKFEHKIFFIHKILCFVLLTFETCEGGKAKTFFFREWLSSVFSKPEVQVVNIFLERRRQIYAQHKSSTFLVSSRFDLPFECSVLRWSTVSWRISAFSSLADPCFSKADGTSRLSSASDKLILSRRFFSITPRRFLRLISWQLSFSMDDGLIEWQLEFI